MNHEGHTTLARTCCGHVKICPHGCVHLTFGQVTLHFHTQEEFEEVALAVAAEAEAQAHDETLDVRHTWFSMSLTAYGSHEFVALVAEAAATLAWNRGDYEFTDVDLFEICRSVAS